MFNSKHTMNMLCRLLNGKLIILLALTLATLPCLAQVHDEIFGPANLLKTMKTPFGFSQQTGGDDKNTLAPLSLAQSSGRSLCNRLLPPRLYLPGRMTIGQTAEFTIKGRANSWAALAMADRDYGAKPIYGKELRLGPDRKLVSLGQIPESGVMTLVIDTPIQGDLIGQQLFFEAAIWSKPDFSDLEIASPVPSDTTATKDAKLNGVMMAGESEKKRGVRFVPEGMVPIQARTGGGSSMSSGRP